MKLVKLKKISITLDLWTHIYPYLDLTAHYINPQFAFKSRVLAVKHLPGSHSTLNIAESVNLILKDWSISQKLFSVVTDNAANVITLNKQLTNPNV